MGEAALVAPDVLSDGVAGSAADMQPVVRVRGFAKRYGKTVACEGIDLEIRRGEIFGLIGPDGAGKSSLMKSVAGVLAFDGGEIEVFGVSLDSERSAERIKDRIGLMPQGLGQNLYAELSIEENIDFFARLRLVPEAALRERKERLLAVTRLDTFRHRAMKNLSGGMKQKLGLVCTLIHEPELVILDEPTTGVDPVSRRDFWSILADLLREKGISALVSTAYMDEASRFQRVAMLYGGRVLAHGQPDEIRGLATGSVVSLKATPQVEAFARLAARFPQVEALGPTLRLFIDGADEETAAEQTRSTLAGFELGALDIAEPELEDIFIALLRKRGLAGSGAPTATTAPSPETPPATTEMPRATASSDTTRETAIEAQQLTRDFGSFRAVDQVSFRVAQGEIFGLLGANGAGKSTVIKMLTGILKPSGGNGQVAGADMGGVGMAIKERIGYMSQAFSLYTDLTVMENIRLYAGIYGLLPQAAASRAAWVIGMAGLAGHEKDRAASLPMGLRQRLALGCALVHQPRVLFLDEPTSGVDPVGRRAFWEILFRLSREEQVAILVTTHYMSEAEHCDHLALMYGGRVVADASPDQMKQDVEAAAGRLIEIGSDAPAHAQKILRAQGYGQAALFGTRVHVLSLAPEADMPRIRQILTEAGLGDIEVKLRPLTMEDVFVYRVTTLETEEHSAKEAS
jgi:ABC-type multidrug transport system ATPase subunit